MRDEFVKRAASESGLYYDSAAIEYYQFKRADKARYDTVEVVTPRDFQVHEVQLEEGVEVRGNASQPYIVASVAGGPTASTSDVILPDGPGFSSFDPVGSGQYVVKTAVGQMLATWAKAKMSGEKRPEVRLLAVFPQSEGQHL